MRIVLIYNQVEMHLLSKPQQKIPNQRTTDISYAYARVKS